MKHKKNSCRKLWAHIGSAATLTLIQEITYDNSIDSTSIEYLLLPETINRRKYCHCFVKGETFQSTKSRERGSPSVINMHYLEAAVSSFGERAKSRVRNAGKSQEEKERVSLVGDNGNTSGTRKASRKKKKAPVLSMPQFEFSMPFGGPKMRAQKLKRRQPDEEKVSLIDSAGRPTKGPRKKRNSSGSAISSKQTKWTPSRLMRYLTLTAFSAFLTFLVMRRQSKALHWQEFNHLLQPEMKKGQSHCYSERRHGQNQRCTCPDPSTPLAGSQKFWKTHHNQMVKLAQNAPKNLDIVFVGDSIVERWQGTTDLGLTVLDKNMKEPFQTRFVKNNGAELEGLALGASSDTGPNLLWHIENGLIDNLNPKLWFISIGNNDLHEEKCTDRVVVASILNVVKSIADRQPDAHFIIHGLLPRKDDPKAKSGFLKKKWKYAQAINTQIRKFCEHSPRLFYMQAGPLFLKETSQEWRGRRSIDQQLLEDGMHPTKRGLEVWGDYIVKQVKQILRDIAEQKAQGLKGKDRRLQIGGNNDFASWQNETIATPY